MGTLYQVHITTIVNLELCFFNGKRKIFGHLTGIATNHRVSVKAGTPPGTPGTHPEHPEPHPEHPEPYPEHPEPHPEPHPEHPEPYSEHTRNTRNPTRNTLEYELWSNARVSLYIHVFRIKFGVMDGYDLYFLLVLLFFLNNFSHGQG